MSIRLDKTDLNKLYQYAILLSQESHNAHDLLQSAVEQYLLEIKRGKTVHNKMAYIRTCIRNRFIDEFRNQKRWQTETYEEQTSYDISPLDLEQTYINQDQLKTIWDTLETIDRDILYHWAVLGFTMDEACQLLDIPRGTALSRIHRLRKRCEALVNETDQTAAKGGT